MKRLIQMMLVVSAAAAVYANTASAALPEFLPTGTKVKGVSTSGPGTLQSPMGTLQCTDDETIVTATGPKTVDITVKFLGCKAFGFANCTTSGAKSGEVVLEGTGTLGFIKGTSPLEVGESLAIKETEVSCGAGLVKLKVRGAAIGVVTPINTSSTTEHLSFAQSGGKQKPEKFEGGSKLTLEVSVNGGAFEESGLATEETTTFAEKITVDG